MSFENQKRKKQGKYCEIFDIPTLYCINTFIDLMLKVCSILLGRVHMALLIFHHYVDHIVDTLKMQSVLHTCTGTRH